MKKVMICIVVALAAMFWSPRSAAQAEPEEQTYSIDSVAVTASRVPVSLHASARTVTLLPVRSVGVMGDERTYEYTVALRAVVSTDGMTADWFPLPYDFMAKVSNDIINKVRGVNRVCYDISSKPPATIEWE